MAFRIRLSSNENCRPAVVGKASEVSEMFDEARFD
jgi:hypothetical protein